MYVSLLHGTAGRSQRDDHLSEKEILLLPFPFDKHERRMCRRMVRNSVVFSLSSNNSHSVPTVGTCHASCKLDPLLSIPFCMTDAVQAETLYWWSIQFKIGLQYKISFFIILFLAYLLIGFGFRRIYILSKIRSWMYSRKMYDCRLVLHIQHIKESFF
jgi:hypothetical protein